MLFRILFIALIGLFIYRLFRRLTGGGGGGQQMRNPFASQRRKPFDGDAVDAEFEELDDDQSKK